MRKWLRLLSFLSANTQKMMQLRVHQVSGMVDARVARNLRDIAVAPRLDPDLPSVEVVVILGFPGGANLNHGNQWVLPGRQMRAKASLDVSLSEMVDLVAHETKQW